MLPLASFEVSFPLPDHLLAPDVYVFSREFILANHQRMWRRFVFFSFDVCHLWFFPLRIKVKWRHIISQRTSRFVSGLFNLFIILILAKYLLHDPIIDTVREEKTQLKRIAKAKVCLNRFFSTFTFCCIWLFPLTLNLHQGRAEYKEMRRLLKLKPKVKFDHIIRERYNFGFVDPHLIDLHTTYYQVFLKVYW